MMREDERTKISVIVPIFKGNKYITRIFDMMMTNISNNMLIDLELILVNDFPQEELIIPDLKSDRFSVRVIVNKLNSGTHFSRVQGLYISCGEYILFLDQDDEISPIYFNEQLKSIGDNDAIICNGKIQGRLIYRNVEELNQVLNISNYKHADNKIASPGQVLIKRKAIPQEWIDNILEFTGADDYFLWMLMFYNDRKMVIHDKVLYCHMFTGDNASNDNIRMNRSVKEVAEFLYHRNILNNEEFKWIYNQRSVIVSKEKKRILLKSILKYKNINSCLIFGWD